MGREIERLSQKTLFAVPLYGGPTSVSRPYEGQETKNGSKTSKHLWNQVLRAERTAESAKQERIRGLCWTHYERQRPVDWKVCAGHQSGVHISSGVL